MNITIPVCAAFVYMLAVSAIPYAFRRPIGRLCHFFQRYYYVIDNQNFEEISCRVNLPSLRATIDELKTLARNVKITENRDQAGMTYEKQGSLRSLILPLT